MNCTFSSYSKKKKISYRTQAGFPWTDSIAMVLQPHNLVSCGCLQIFSHRSQRVEEARLMLQSLVLADCLMGTDGQFLSSLVEVFDVR